MKLSDIIALFTLCVMTKAAWLAAVVQPVILGFGAVLAAFDLDILDSLPFITYITIVDNPAFLKQNIKERIGKTETDEEAITPDTVTRDGEEKVVAESEKKDVGLTEEELNDLKSI